MSPWLLLVPMIALWLRIEWVHEHLARLERKVNRGAVRPKFGLSEPRPEDDDKQGGQPCR